jgi:hypothetical protein
MTDNHEQHLEGLIRRELSRLPLVPAPPTLVHRVMLAVHERARQPWWRRSWATWPIAVRVLFLFCALGIACVGLLGLVQLNAGLPLAHIADQAAQSLGFLRPIWDVCVALAGALALVARAVSPWLVWSLALTLGVVYLASVGLGTLCCRVALNKV